MDKASAGTRRPVLSSLFLNWNRGPLLARTLRSYLATVSLPHEVLVVDNASTDDSRSIIAAALRRGEIDDVVLADENLGGEAINLGLARLSGDFLHVSENDIEYEPGWDRSLLAKFEAFPPLGQLSPFSPSPRREKGEVSPSHLHQVVGGEQEPRICLAARGITTTSVMRRSVFDRGVRWRSICSGAWRWPDDAGFSLDVQALGLWVAWNDVSVAINTGHTVQEWNRDLGYYLDSYASKPWVGVAGWRTRLYRAGYDLVGNDGGQHIAATWAQPIDQRQEPG